MPGRTGTQSPPRPRQLCGRTTASKAILRTANFPKRRNGWTDGANCCPAGGFAVKSPPRLQRQVSDSRLAALTANVCRSPQCQRAGHALPPPNLLRQLDRPVEIIDAGQNVPEDQMSLPQAVVARRLRLQILGGLRCGETGTR